jgi:hypothetical protein
MYIITNHWVVTITQPLISSLYTSLNLEDQNPLCLMPLFIVSGGGYNWTFYLFPFEQKHVDSRFSEAECIKIDAVNRKVYCRSNINNNSNEKQDFVVDYDYLIIAVGANVNTFNTPGVTEHCHFLKVTFFLSLGVSLHIFVDNKNCACS